MRSPERFTQPQPTGEQRISAGLPEQVLIPETEKYISAVRVFPLAARPVVEIVHELQEKAPEDIFYTETILIQKGGDVSHNLLQPPGGKRDENKSVYLEGAAELDQELTAITDCVRSQEERHNSTFARTKTFTYHIPDNRYTSGRRLRIMMMRIRSRDRSFLIPKEGFLGPRDKIKGIYPVTVDDLTQLIEHGVTGADDRQLFMIGHLTKAATPMDPIRISAQDAGKRDKALAMVLDEARRYEGEMRYQILGQINLMRARTSAVTAVTLNDCLTDEIALGFIAAQMHMAYEDERKLRGEGIYDEIPKAMDALKVVPYLMSAKPEYLKDLLWQIPTREALRPVTLLKRALRDSITQLYAMVGRDIHREYPQPLRTIELYSALWRVWPDVLRAPNHMEILREMNEIFSIQLAKALGVPRARLYRALELADDFTDFMNDSIQRNKDLPNYFQEHQSAAAVRNARPFSLLVMAARLHPNKDIHPNHPHSIRVSNDATRKWVICFETIRALEILDKADISELQESLDAFLPGEPVMHEIQLPDGMQHYPRVYAAPRMSWRGKVPWIGVDERRKKGAETFVRKSLQSAGEIKDIYSINFYAADRNFGRGVSDTIVNHIRLAQQLRRDFTTFAKERMEKRGWKVSVMPGTLDTKAYDRIREFRKLAPNRRKAYVETLYSGDRPGSRGDLIMREKFILRMEKNGTAQYCEINIYPFEQARAGSARILGKAGFWGFTEKITDDALGEYTGKRLVAKGRVATAPSLYDEYFQSFIYHWLLVKMAGYQAGVRTIGEEASG